VEDLDLEGSWRLRLSVEMCVTTHLLAYPKIEVVSYTEAPSAAAKSPRPATSFHRMVEELPV
jgi:hypothetical protein